MSISKQVAKALGAWLIAFGVACHAGGGGPMSAATGGATELTQVANNVELVKSSLDTASIAQNTISKYLLQLQQYQAQVVNMTGVNPQTLATNTTDINSSYAAVQNYSSALQALQGSLATQQSAMDQRLVEAKLSNLSWPDYVNQVQAAASTGNEKAKARIANEQAVMQQVDSDYQFAREQQAQIPANVGVQQSLQQLNSQMNRVVTQNAQMIAIMAKANGSDKAADDTRAVTSLQRAQIVDAAVQRQAALRQRQAAETQDPQ